MKHLSVFRIFFIADHFFLDACSTFVQDIKTISKPLTFTITFDSNSNDEITDDSTNEPTVHGTMEPQLFTKKNINNQKGPSTVQLLTFFQVMQKQGDSATDSVCVVRLNSVQRQ